MGRQSVTRLQFLHATLTFSNETTLRPLTVAPSFLAANIVQPALIWIKGFVDLGQQVKEVECGRIKD